MPRRGEECAAARLALCVACAALLAAARGYNVDTDDIGRRFDGIGGISGGGATSRLLVDYAADVRRDVLDYLFLPEFGASLHLLKVEIGGDAQSTDGTEASHMHAPDDLDYSRGYEWWLMNEAKQRNPGILLYGLSWGVPGWIGNGTYYSPDNIRYQISWLEGARSVYNLTIDYIGIWNERPYNAEYIKQLRKALDSKGFQSTTIVAADGDWDPIVDDMAGDAELRAAVGVVGVHYPGTTSPPQASLLNTPLWASEDYSTYAAGTGPGCWAKILNQNYVVGNMTGTIAWNLIGSYYDGLPYIQEGLMAAQQPWSGNYDVQAPVRLTAHYTQFMQPGWRYVKHGSGSGMLARGGSMSVAVSPDDSHVSIFIEKISWGNGFCIRPTMPEYAVAAENVSLSLAGRVGSRVKSLAMWRSTVQPYGSQQSDGDLFEYVGNVAVHGGAVTVAVGVDQVITLSTLTGGRKGQHKPPASPQPFPLPYADDFEAYADSSEAKYFADQAGSFEIVSSARGKTMRQMSLQPPIKWCDEPREPLSLIGDSRMADVTVSVLAMVEATGTAVVGARVPQGGCTDSYRDGFFLSLDESGDWALHSGARRLANGKASPSAGAFTNMTLQCRGRSVTASLDGATVAHVPDAEGPLAGFAAIGSSFAYVQFDDFYLDASIAPSGTCGSGPFVSVALIGKATPDQQWSYATAAMTVSPLSNASLCLTAADSAAPSPLVTACETPPPPAQQWALNSTVDTIVSQLDGSCLQTDAGSANLCARAYLAPCTGQLQQRWVWFQEDATVRAPLSGYGLALSSLTGS